LVSVVGVTYLLMMAESTSESSLSPTTRQNRNWGMFGSEHDLKKKTWTQKCYYIMDVIV